MSKTMLVMTVVAASLTGCVQEPPAEVTETASGARIGHGVTRVDDPQRGVSCYVFSGIKKGGISCLRTGAGHE